jgi:glucose/mannose transport system substrate-binding protein
MAALAAALSLLAAPAAAQELLIYHNWSSPTEIASLKVLRDHFEAGGGVWKDLSIPHDSGTNVSLINMLTGGNPPDVFAESSPGLYRDLKSQGLAFPLAATFDEIGATPNFPEAVRKSITVDGEIMKIPMAVHIDGMIFYNTHVAQAVGVDPKSWKSLDDFFAVYDKIKAAGYIPLAIGGEKWQIGYLLHALMAAETGGAIYERIYGGTPDRGAIDSPEMRTTLAMLRKFQQHADPGSPNRKWNDTTNLVITGQAFMQVHGDWMKGEFRTAGKQLGTDYDCMNIPGAKGVVVTVDAFGLIDTRDAAKTKAQKLFASVVVDPKIQAQFAAIKGSSPVRLDSPTDQLDACNAIVHDLLANPAIQHENPYNTADADWMSAIWDEADKFWNDPNMTDADFIAGLQNAYDTIF